MVKIVSKSFLDRCGKKAKSFACKVKGRKKELFPLSFSLSTEVDECTLGSHDCDKNAECINTDGSFICTCKKGFSKAGTNGACTGKFNVAQKSHISNTSPLPPQKGYESIIA